MPFFRNILMGIALSVAGLLPSLASAAMPRLAEPSTTAPSEIIGVRYVCDNYGCYDRPDYGRPPPPGYYRPAPPPPPPPGYYRPAPPPPPPPGYYRPAPPPPPPRAWGRHIRWCMDRHRAYNPDTNRFIGSDGRPHVCRSPFY